MTTTPNIRWSHITMGVYEGSVEGSELNVLIHPNRAGGASGWSLLFGYSDGEPVEFSHCFTAEGDREAMDYAVAWVAANPHPKPED